MRGKNKGSKNNHLDSHLFGASKLPSSRLVPYIE